jgi:hypothetical protein
VVLTPWHSNTEQLLYPMSLFFEGKKRVTSLSMYEEIGSQYLLLRPYLVLEFWWELVGIIPRVLGETPIFIQSSQSAR